MARVSFKKRILAMTGISDDDYKRQYRNIKSRTANYNAVAGTTYSAAQVFYASVKYSPDELSTGIKNVLSTVATNPHTSGEFKETRIEAIGEKALDKTTEKAKKQILQRWAKFIASSKDNYENHGGSGDAYLIAEDMKNGIITPAAANNALKTLAASLPQLYRERPTYKY